jgi:hypothetical protein
MRLSAIRAGQLGGGSLAGRPAFSWAAALITIAAGIAMFILSRIPVQRWRRHQRILDLDPDCQEPRYEFYQETLDQLARLGIERIPSQTPAELSVAAQGSTEHPERFSLVDPLDALTAIYNHVRYGGEENTHDPVLARNQQPWPLPERYKSQAENALERLRQQIDEITAEQTST